MAQSFNLVAQLSLRGPTNVRQIAANLSRQLGVTANVNVQFNRNANRTISQMTTNINNLNKALSNLDQVANRTTTTIQNLVNAISNLANSQRRITVAVRQTGQTMTQTSKATQDMSTSVEHFGKQSALAIRRFAAFLIPARAFLAVTSGIDKGFRAAVNFERELVKVAQVTGQTLGGLKDLSAEITRVSTTFGVASTDLLKASTVLSQAGLTATEVRKSLQLLAMTDLAPNFESMTDTVEGFIAIRQQFGTSVDGMTAALSSLNAVAGAYAVESGDIITAIRKTGGAFRAAGGDLNQLVALFTSVRQTTRESADSIATGFRTIFTRMQRLGTSKLLKQVGIDLRDMAGNFVGPFEAVKRLSDALSRVDPRSQLFSQVIEELGGFRQVSKVIPLIQQFGVAQEAYNVALRNTNSLEQESAKAKETLANRLVALNEQFLSLFRTLTGNEVFRTMTGGVLTLASSLIKLADSLEPIIPLLTAFASVKLARAIPGFTAGFVGGIRRAGGGFVPGQGNTDSVPAMLTPGEFVIRKSAAKALGPNTLNRMNKYANGGEVDVLGSLNREIDDILAAESGGRPLLESEKKKLLKQRGLEGKQATASQLQKIKAGPKVVSIGSIPEFGGFFFDDDQSYVGATKGGDLSVSYKTLSSGGSNLLRLLNITEAEAQGLSVVGQPRAMFLPPNLESRFGQVLNGAVDNITSGVIEKALGIRVDDLNLGLSKSFNKQKFFESARSSVDYRDISGKIFESFISGLSAQVGQSTDTFDFRPGRKPKVFDKIFGPGAGRLQYADTKLTATRYAFEELISKAVAAAKGPPNQLSPDHLSLFYGGEGPTRSLRAFKARESEYRVKRASGGGVPGVGGGDTVPALLTPGEFVINKNAAQKIGYSTLNNLNNVQKFATGGFVGAGNLIGPRGLNASNPVYAGLLQVVMQQLQTINPTIQSAKALQRASAILAQAYKTNANVTFTMSKTGQATITGLQSLNKAVTQAKINMARQQGGATKGILAPTVGGLGLGVGGVLGLSSVASVLTGGNNEVIQNISQIGITIGTMGLIANDVNSGLTTLAQKLKLVNGQSGVNKLFRYLSMVSTASSILSGSLLAYSSILNDRAAKVANNVTDPESFEQFVRYRTQANNVQGAGLGAQLGQMAGTVLGTGVGLLFGGAGAIPGAVIGGAAGTAIGGFLGGRFGGGLVGDDPQMEAAVLRQAQGTENLANILNAINSGEAFAGASTGAIREAMEDALSLTGRGRPNTPETRQAQSLLAKQDVAITATIKKFLDLNGTLDAFEKGVGSDLIALLAEARSSTYDAVRKEIQVELDARRKSAEAITALNSSILNLNNNMQALASGQKSFELALENAERGMAALGGGFFGFGSLDVTNATNLNQYRSVATNLLGSLGPRGTALGNRAADFAMVSRDLPSLLSQLVGVNPDQIELGNEFSEILKRTFPQLSQDVVNEFNGMLAQLIAGSENNGLSFQERLRSRPDEVANELLNQGGKEYGQALNAAAETIAKFTNMYSDKLTEVIRNLDQLTDLEFRKIAAQTEGRSIFARAYGAPASVFSNINADARNREQSVLGNPFGGTSRGVQFLRSFIINSENTIRELRKSINDPTTDNERRLELIKQEKLLTKSATDATTALNKLADSSGRINDLQSELAQAQSVRDSKRGLLDDFIFGAPTDRMKMLTDANLSVGALMRGSLAGIPGAMRPNVGSFLSRLDPNMTLNGMRVDDLVKNLKINEATAMGLPAQLAQGIYLPGEQEQEILRSIQEAIDLSVEANDALGVTIENSNAFLVQSLDGLNRAFLTDLKNIFLGSEIRGLESRRLNVQSQKSNAETVLLDTAKQIKNLFGSGNSLVRGRELATVLSSGKVQQALRTISDPRVQGEQYFKSLDVLNEAFGKELGASIRQQFLELERNEPGSGQQMFNAASGIVETLNTFGTNFTSLFDRLNKELAQINRELEAVRQQVPINRAGGGFARGTDTVPAMLTPGEYVVNAAAARKNRTTLDHMNFGGVVYRAGGGSLNGSEQMARDIRIIAGKAYRYVNGKLEPIRQTAADMHAGAGLAVDDWRKSPGFTGALFGGFTAQPGPNAPGIGKALLDGATGLFNPYKNDTLYEQDQHESRMRYDAGYYYQNTGRIRVPSPYAKKRQHTPAEQAYIDNYKKMYDEQQKKAAIEEKKAYRAQYRPDYGPQYQSGELDNFVGGLGDNLRKQHRTSQLSRGLSAVYGFEDTLNSIHDKGVAAKDYRDYLSANAATRGSRRSDMLRDRRANVAANVEMRRQGRRSRLGYNDASPLAPDPVRQQEVSRQQNQRDSAAYDMSGECCEIKAQLASALENFTKVAPPMTDAMNNLADKMVSNPIPSEITHTGQQEVHVAITGLNSQLNGIGEALKPFIVNIVRDELSKGSVSSASPLQRMAGKG